MTDQSGLALLFFCLLAFFAVIICFDTQLQDQNKRITVLERAIDGAVEKMLNEGCTLSNPMEPGRD